jgi:hypothetical protein
MVRELHSGAGVKPVVSGTKPMEVSVWNCVMVAAETHDRHKSGRIIATRIMIERSVGR